MHVIQRGNDRKLCFREQSDYFVYLKHLRELLRKAACALHAYCLMPNHVHMLLTPKSEASVTTFMRDLGQRYVPYFNRRYGRTGTLWEGRFRSCLTESPEYVLSCYRYIELNPVRAGLSDSAEGYRWSSYQHNVGATRDDWIDAHPDFESLGGAVSYRRLFSLPLEDVVIARIRESTQGGYPLVGDGLRARLEAENTRPLTRSFGGRPKKNVALTPVLGAAKTWP